MSIMNEMSDTNYTTVICEKSANEKFNNSEKYSSDKKEVCVLSRIIINKKLQKLIHI